MQHVLVGKKKMGGTGEVCAEYNTITTPPPIITITSNGTKQICRVDKAQRFIVKYIQIRTDEISMDRKNWLKLMLPKGHIIRTSSNAGESNMETESTYQGKFKKTKECK